MRVWLLPLQLRPHHVGRLREYSNVSRDVRAAFLDYFETKHKHRVMPNCSLVPRDDPTLNFVNAGMNQWKNVFLGTQNPPVINDVAVDRVASSQRCVRLNDLDLVGHDGHHHTLFEMLGNWAFNDAYNREEACLMAYDLLTNVFQLDPSRLHVTVFEGCPKMNVGPDRESESVWRSLGIPDNRINRLGPQENFWSMGLSGPCGPCSEIHYRHSDDKLVELWNLVFMQYNKRLRDDSNEISLESLTSRHVDTGMGLERLCAVLNQTTSNYDSDLFKPLMEYISSHSRQPAYGKTFNSASNRLDLDTGYRILSDHSRMLTACLLDGMLPETQNKVKSIMRRALRISKDIFHCDEQLLVGLSRRVLDTWGENPNEQTLQLISAVIESEGQQYRELEEQGLRLLPKLLKDHPKVCELDVVDVPLVSKLITFLRRRQQPRDDFQDLSCINEELAVQLHQNFGVDISRLQMIGYILGLSVDLEACSKAILKSREQSKGLQNDLILTNCKVKLPRSDDRWKYKCRRDGAKREYHLPKCEAQVKVLLDEKGKSVDKLKESEKGVVFLDKTCFYAEAGGQEGDQGQLLVHFSHQQSGVKFSVEDCKRIAGTDDIIAHFGSVIKGEILLNSRVSCTVKKKARQQRMLNHTGLHILNASLRKTVGLALQTSSKVTVDDFKLDVNTFKKELTPSVIAEVERLANAMVASDDLVRRTTVKRDKFLALQKEQKVVTLPGEHYPEQVHIIRLPDGTREACCGTHVTKTGDVQCITVTNVRGAGVKSLRAITGQKALVAREQGVKVLKEALSLQKMMGEIESTPSIQFPPMKRVETLNMKLTMLQNVLSNPSIDIPYVVRCEVSPTVNSVAQKLIGLSKERILLEISKEIKDVVARRENESFVLYLVKDEEMNQSNRSINYHLSKLTRHCPHKPILLARVSNNSEISARACVPERFVSASFDASQWLSSFADVFKASVKTPTHQRPQFFSNMAAVSTANLERSEFEVKLKEAWRLVHDMAKKAFEQSSTDNTVSSPA